MHERFQSARSAVENIEANSRLEFRCGPAGILPPGSQNELQLKAKSFLKRFLVLLSEICGRWATGDDLLFLFRCINDFLPFILRIGCAGSADEKQDRDNQCANFE